jgi:hypothetical protein
MLILLAALKSAYLGTVNRFYFLPNRWHVAIGRGMTKMVVVRSDKVLRKAKESHLASAVQKAV